MPNFAGVVLDETGGMLPVEEPGKDPGSYANLAPIPGEKIILPDITLGPSTVGVVADPARLNTAGVCLPGVAEDWLNRVHVIPRRFDFGNILGTTNSPISIFSAFRDQNILFTDFLNNSGAGLSITDLPTLPVVLEPFGGLELNVQVTTNGVPQFNTTMDFTFSPGGVILVPITGSRVIMFPYRPEVPMTEEMAFLTEVLPHTDGSEQRISLRKNPRQSFKMKMRREEGTERSRIDFLLFDWQTRVFGVPMWPEEMSLTSEAAVDDATINVNTTDFADLRIGGLAIVLQQDEITFDALEIASFTATSITFSAGVQNIHPIGTKVYPIKISQISGLVKGSRRPVRSGDFDVNFQVLDNDTRATADTSAFSSFEGKVLLDDPNVISRELSESYQKQFVLFDAQTGVFSQDSTWTRNKRGSSKTFRTKSREELWNIRRLLSAFRGRQVSWWLPTFYQEIIPTDVLPSGGATMTITNVGYARFVQDRAPKNKFRVILNDGTVLERTVLSSSEIDKNTEQITFTTTWPSTIQVDEIDKVDILELVRLDVDTIRIIHRVGSGFSEINFPVKVVFE